MPKPYVTPSCSISNCPAPGHYEDFKIVVDDIAQCLTHRESLGHYCAHHWNTRPEMRPIAIQYAVDWMAADPAFLDEVIAKRRELDRLIKGK